VNAGVAGEAVDEDHVVASGPAGDRVCASIDAGAGAGEHRVDNRQYGLTATAAELGWLAGQIVVIDADLGVSRPLVTATANGCCAA
jgi:hypothetical protein